MPQRFDLPATRDPFVNTPLVSLGVDDSGEERFWISSWNAISGSQGIMVSESGASRVFRFGQPWSGFYSAVAEDPNTLWLCGSLAQVARLDLRTGDLTHYDTGAPYALMFPGMILDDETGKLFAAAFPLPRSTGAAPSTMGFSFDTRARKPVTVHADLCYEHYQTTSFANGDGTHTAVVYNPDIALLRWNPADETVTKTLVSELGGGAEHVDNNAGISALAQDDRGFVYLGAAGWYDPVNGQVDGDGPRPETEMTWFARRGQLIYGANESSGVTTVGVWDLATGQVRRLCDIPDGTRLGIALASSGNIVAVSLFGTFYRINPEDGSVDLCRHIDSDSVGRIDCLRRIDDNRLLGTPYITQRFWQLDLSTGRGEDLGRAAPGRGEILRTWKINEKVYLAAYTGAELLEYDPDRPSRFPENPRVVAVPPAGMRPVASADDGQVLYYASNHHYGVAGCVLTRYDTASGIARFHDDPLLGQAIRTLVTDTTATTLLAATATEVDCETAIPVADRCCFARIDGATLDVIHEVPAPADAKTAGLHGVVRVADDGSADYLCTIRGVFGGSRRPQGPSTGGDVYETRWFVMRVSDDVTAPLEACDLADTRPMPDEATSVTATGHHGIFILQSASRFTLWDFRPDEPVMLAVVCDEPGAYACHVQDGIVYTLVGRQVLIDEDLLASSVG